MKEIVLQVSDEEHERLSDMMVKTGAKTHSELISSALKHYGWDINGIENQTIPGFYDPGSQKFAAKISPEFQHVKIVGDYTAKLIQAAMNKKPPGKGRE